MLGLCAGAAAAGTLALAAPAMAAGPSAAAKPKGNLKTNQVITVTFSGFPASTTVYALQCSKAVKVASDAKFCDVNPSHVKTGKSNAKGAGSFKFTVHTGKIGAGTCATKSTNCKIAVAANTKPPKVANAVIHFGVA